MFAERRGWSGGLKVEFEEWWFNLRPSNTEPLIRLNVEARDAASGEARRDEILSHVAHVAHVEHAEHAEHAEHVE
ncbi:MAG: hypothetical protein NVSMB57_13070 [Actinomycetota bacterium]